MPIAPSSKFLSNIETTILKPDEERRFQNWAQSYNIQDVDHPDSFYDYRGYWKDNPVPDRTIGYGPVRVSGQHYPDTYKQRGHPTFSQESQYSRGPYQGGMWNEDQYLPQPPMAVSHIQKRR